MDINKYTVFLEVARQESISRAAETLGYTQSGISHTIKRLEKEMNLKLFDRSRNGAFLTAAGRELYPSIADLVQCQERVSQTIDSLHDLARGTLNIGTITSIAREWLPPIIQRFKIDYPDIQIHFMEGGSEEILNWVEERSVDLGFMSGVNYPDIDWIPLMEDRLMAILPHQEMETPGLDLPNVSELSSYPLKQFNDQTFIISALGIDSDIHGALEKYKIHPDIQYSAKDDNTIISMVACGLGTSILPELVLHSSTANVITMPLLPSVSRTLGIAIPAIDTASPATLKFIEYTKEFLGVS
ncbi:MAG: LysR family transcriptional regulator [Lachnospiraceae bacterium]|nr:LysR family transcriptional regulator [Lachnospiraceae bacterium]